MSLLTVVQDFCRKTNLSVPNSVLGSSDEQVIQIYSLLQEEGDELCTRGDWQQLVREATHTTLAAESQGLITTIASGFERFKHDTLWNRSDLQPIYVVDAEEWQQSKGTANTGPNYQVRLRGDYLIANPTPEAGLTWAFEYVSKNWILDDDGTTYKSVFSEDADTFVFPEKLLKAGLRWRWKKEKGFEYAEDFRSYEAMLRQILGANGLRKNLNMSSRPEFPKPRVLTSDGSWPL